MPYVSSSERLMEKQMALLADADPALHAYVHRLVDDRKLKPALFHGDPFPGLWSYIRDHHGGGDYCIFIHRAARAWSWRPAKASPSRDAASP